MKKGGWVFGGFGWFGGFSSGMIRMSFLALSSLQLDFQSIFVGVAATMRLSVGLKA